MKKFYSHLIEIESLTIELNSMDLSESEKSHLARLIDDHLHNTVLDTIFSQLSEEDKQALIYHMKQNADDQVIWDHLNSKVDNIEDKIIKAVEDLKKELHTDIKEAHKLGGNK